MLFAGGFSNMHLIGLREMKVVAERPMQLHLRELHRSVVTNQELSNTVKLPVFKSISVPFLTYEL